MISYEEALAIIAAQVEPLAREQVVLGDLPARVLAAPVCATTDLPGFDNSAVDGFGVKLADVAAASEITPAVLTLAAVVRAGDEPLAELFPGHTIKILTGAPIPRGVEAVVMKEFCREENGQGQVRVSITARVGAAENIRRRGEEYRQGDVILTGSQLVTPPVVGLLATLGHSQFLAFRRPRAAVISTGDELVKPGQPLKIGQIYDSNSVALAAALEADGASPCTVLHAAEDFEATRGVFTQALADADIVVSAGGVSVGDFDFVKAACEALGVETLIWRISIKPGKPVYFGVRQTSERRQYVFGLPGNPVSALVTYQQFVRPALALMAGQKQDKLARTVTARLTRSIRKRAGRSEFVRGRWRLDGSDLVVEPTTGQESHMLGGLCLANGLIVFAKDKEELKQGEQVHVQLLDW